MANNGFLRLNVGFFPKFEDGDIMSAINWRKQRCCYAEQLCFARGKNRFARANKHGFLNHADVLKDWCDNVYQFRFERLSSSEAKVVRLADMNEIRFTSNKPFEQHDGKIVHMDIAATFARKIRTLRDSNNGRGIPIFCDDGDENSVVYYGGRKDTSHAKLDIIWPQIESKLGVLESSIPNPTFSDKGSKSLLIRVDDFADDAGLDSPLMDETDPENPVQVKERKHRVDWRALSGVDSRNVLDKRVRSDDTATLRSRDSVVIAKTR